MASAPQKPWLGLPQWVALVAASLSLGVANSLLQGRALEELPAIDVAAESGLLLAMTALVCVVPAGVYWVARKAWMPELTRFVWLAWIVVDQVSVFLFWSRGMHLTAGLYALFLAMCVAGLIEWNRSLGEAPR